ncbi:MULTISPECIES: DUF7007 domain-containing protein [Rhizobium/Agrobacterium group]|uniref:DUF7007 domain-containing protein n=1 Tax=Rhizobium/Agrobacterium group TaxID=227290 RepID=UPI001574DBA9|nr:MULTISPECIES: hypothetical protein [Rhizobium/Agrobacterium group]NTC82530.1 hypothetical protein [Agrobacterium tumefaciens]NTD11353.1 hypothetical protein [Agrobacterium tumefaciens]NTD85709.1 hypothetical protein [Agrobacterium tumefaciens]NTD93982.1 hypothetical protein [Agrobacterium tumefaciens]NTD97133.1 hypothetical protein [Agrobacterium tumefaciens]
MAEIHDDTAAEKAAHETELQALDRPTIQAGASTPWGTAQVSRRYADGIVLHSTASHGGFHLDEIANAVVHPLYRNDGGFYEEDCEWAKVAHAFPHLFTAYERRLADRTLRDYFPDAYERDTGAILNSGQSHMRDRQEFESVHRNDWVVIAALNSDQQLGFVECIATLGGIRGEVGERRFLVPRSDYSIGRHGFVIDPLKHQPYDGPSSFVTWAARR